MTLPPERLWGHEVSRDLDYVSPNRLIVGRRDPFRYYKAILLPSWTQIPLEVGHLRIHFATRLSTLYEKPETTPNFGEKRKIMRLAIDDYLAFLNDLRTNPSLADIQLVSGSTNPRMAKFALSKLGFELTHLQFVRFKLGRHEIV